MYASWALCLKVSNLWPRKNSSNEFPFEKHKVIIFFNTAQHSVQIPHCKYIRTVISPSLHGDLYILPTNNTFFSFCKRKLITLIKGNQLIK